MRPTGVTILAVLNFIGAALSVLAGLLFFLGMGMAGVASERAGAKGMLLGLGAMAGVIFLLFGAFYVVVGVGLWKLRNWARIVAIILTCLTLLSLIPGLLGLFASLLHFRIFAFLIRLVFFLIFAAFYGWILWYMFRPHVKQAFGAS